ncbi:MAG: helical backbone metal receptor [Acidimicrobiales bacterium]
MRVVSLVPSATETLVAWGVTPVGVTRFCEHPELPSVGGTKDPDLDAVQALRPDLVVVCQEENRAQDAAALQAAGVRLFVFRIDAVDDVAPQLGALRADLGLDPAPPPQLPPAATEPTSRAFVPIWRRPWMTMSGRCYGSSLLARLGVVNVFADEDDRYPETTLEEAAARAPDVVLAPSEPYPFGARHVDELATVAPVLLVDGQDLFWWGVRTPAALDRLGAALDDLGHRGRG